MIYQFFNGVNFFGFPAEHYVPGVSDFSHIARLGGVFNDELVVGSFIAKLSYPLIFYGIHISIREIIFENIIVSFNNSIFCFNLYNW